MSRRRVNARLATLLAISATVAAVSCSGSTHQTVAGVDSAPVLAAYRSWWSDYSFMTRSYPVDPANPRLEVHTAGAEVGRLQAQLTSMRSRQQFIQGPLVDNSTAVVTALQSTTATIQDCYLDRSYLVNGRSQVVENRPIGQRALAHVTLERLNGTWKVTLFTTLSVGCHHA